MATVRITASLKRQIEQNVMDMTSKQQDELPNLSVKQATTLLHRFAEEHKLFRPEDEFLHSLVGVIQIKTPKTNWFAEVTPTQMVVPYSITHTISPLCVSISTNHIQDSTLDKIIQKRLRVEEGIKAFNITFKQLIGKCTTLKQLIEAWPQVEQFIPKKYLDKHYFEERKLRKKGVYLEDEEKAVLNELLLVSKLDS